jgi:bifunctional non-homologous end joining protein LigD
VVWVQPTLVAEIEYRAWTDDQILRHASYKGLRDKQDNAALYQIKV